MAANNTPVDCRSPDEILRQILTTMKDRLFEEEKTQTLTVPCNDLEARFQYYAGLDLATVNKLIQRSTVSRLDIPSRVMVLRTVKNMYALRRIQCCTINSLYRDVSRSGLLRTLDGKLVKSMKDLAEQISIMGFEWKSTVKNVRLLIENPELRFARYLYLYWLSEYRNKSPQWQIVYVDERLIDDAQDFSKPWLKKGRNMKLEPNECVFYHAVSRNGFITGMFYNEISETDFAKWITDMLLMHLKSPTVLIMDNNPLHGSLEKVCSITTDHSKIDMMRWLMNNNIPCSINMSKPDMFNLVKKCSNNQRRYKIDSILESHGHKVLRLPRHFYDLSMTTPLWDSIIKGGLVKNSLVHMQNQLMNLMNTIGLAKWEEYHKMIEKHETELFAIDVAMEAHSDKHKIKI